MSTVENSMSTVEKSKSTVDKSTSTVEKSNSTVEKSTSTVEKSTSTMEKSRSTMEKSTSTVEERVYLLPRQLSFGCSENTPGLPTILLRILCWVLQIVCGLFAGGLIGTYSLVSIFRPFFIDSSQIFLSNIDIFIICQLLEINHAEI